MGDVQDFRLDRLFKSYEDGEGYITLASFTGHIGELARMGGVAPDDERHVALEAHMTDLWNQLASLVDTDGDGRVSRAEWDAWARGMVEFLKASVAAGEPWPLDDWIDTLFGVIDRDGDGHLTLDEYRDWLTVLHLADGMDVPAVFAAFDKDRHGFLSRDEFSAITRDYWTNFDANIPAHRWLGP